MPPNLPGHLYRIQNNPHYFYAGHLENGNQILMGVQLPELVSVEFDPDGNYIGMAVREIARTKQDSSGFDAEKLSVELRVWQSELGITPGTISVKRFFLPDRWIGIHDLPDYCQEVIDRPEDYDSERIREIEEHVRQWSESGDFVLYWNEDYYLSQEGEVVGS